MGLIVLTVKDCRVKLELDEAVEFAQMILNECGQIDPDV